MGLLNQLHLFIHQKWSQTRLIKRVHRLREPLLRAKGTTWIVDGNITALIPACIPTLGFDQLGAELEKPLLDGQTDREILCQETASFSLLNNLVLHAGQNSIHSESAGWFLVPFLSF